MARYPGARYRPLSSTQGEPRLRKKHKVILHTMVGSLWGTDSYFRQGGWSGTESHYGVGGDGEILQWQDTDYQADAQLYGNDDAISIETADMGPEFKSWNTSGDNVPAWTAAQCEAISQLIAFHHRVDGIPIVLIKDTRDGTKGIGYHRQGVDPYRKHGEKYSNAYGKVCPGNRRIAQIPGILARARQIAAGGGSLPDTGRDWLDMASKEDVKDAFREVLNEKAYRSPSHEKTGAMWSLAHIIDWMGRRVHGLEDRTATEVWGFPLNDPLDGDGATVKAGDALRSTRYHSYQGDLQTNDIPGQVWTHEVKNSVYGGTSKVGDVVRATHRAATVAGDLWPEDEGSGPDLGDVIKFGAEQSAGEDETE